MTQLHTQPPFYGKGRITQVAEQRSNKMEPRTLKNQSQVAELAPNQGTANMRLTGFQNCCVSVNFGPPISTSPFLLNSCSYSTYPMPTPPVYIGCVGGK